MRIYLLSAFLLLTQICNAQQWDLGGGPALSAPLIYNSEVGDYHHSSRAVSFRATARYLPANLSFYPQLTISAGGTEIPLAKVDNIVVQMYLMQWEAILGARIIARIDETKEFHYGIGMGAMYYQSEGISVALKGNQNGYYGSSDNDISGLLPTVNISGEFVAKSSKKKPVYVGIGGQLGYTYFSNTTPTVHAGITTPQQPGTQLEVGPKGNMITPQLSISVYYRFGEQYY